MATRPYTKKGILLNKVYVLKFFNQSGVRNLK